MKEIIIVFLFYSISSIAQVNQEWVSIYDGPRQVYDEATCIAVDKVGNVIVAGTSGVDVSWAITTVKYNNQGVQRWVRTYGHSQVATAHDIKTDDWGNIYVTGGSLVGSPGFDMVTIKYDSLGNQLWMRNYNGVGNDDDESYKLSVDDYGNVYVSGYSLISSNNYELVLIKYNNLGSQQWVKHYNTQTYNNGKPLGLDLFRNKYIYVASRTNNAGVLIKYDSSGSTIWTRVFKGSPVELALDEFENIYLTGVIRIDIYNHYLIMKFNSSGDSLWESIYDGPPGDDIANAIAVDGIGNVFVTGRSYGGSSSLDDYLTVKFDSLGFEKWNRRYNGAGDGFDEAKSIAVDKEGNVYITGHTTSGTNYYHNNCTTVKYKNNGTQVWDMRFNDVDFSEGNQLILDSVGNVYVCGKTDFGGIGFNMLTIKYSQPVGIKNAGNQLPNQFSLSQNYPNPFNPVTRIKFSLPSPSEGGVWYNVRLVIYDILGREVETLIPPLGGGQEGLKPGSYEVTWDGSRYASGVYFYKLMTDEYVETRKMVLIK